MANKAESIKSDLISEFPDLDGALFVKEVEDKVTVWGFLQANSDEPVKAIKKYLSSEYPDSSVKVNIEVAEKKGLLVGISEEDTTEITDVPDDDGVIQIDQVEVLYMGEFPLKAIEKTDGHYKTTNPEAFRKVETCISVFGYSDPVVLDQNLEVIDGNMRVAVALERLRDKKTTKTTIPVVILKASQKKADFLRLALNRSQEFPRWMYRDIDAYLESVPQLQPLLEPLGFFGERILPTSFFGGTVINYQIDPYNLQQQQYKQEYGLDSWAKMQRERRDKLEAAKKNSMTVPATKKTVSLLDKVPTEADYLPVVDVEKATEIYVSNLKEEAEEITNKADEEGRKIREEKGQVWQNSRKTTKQLAAERRKAAEEALKKAEEEEAEAEASDKEEDN